MKIKWSVEGSGCNNAGCGLPDFKLEIDDSELEGLDDTGRHNFIDELVQHEFETKVYPYWEIVSSP